KYTGASGPKFFCFIVFQGQFCDYCNAADPSKAHPITNAIDGTERWWQSPPLSLGLKYNEVNVTLDLGQLFHVAYLLIKFANSPRPDLWVLERSVDFGRTYAPWQYFAHSKADCLEHFGKKVNAPIRKDDDVICTTEYSRIVPLENGEIVVSLVNGRPGAKNFTYSPILRKFTKATNIRLRFLRTNTLLGHLISKAQRDPTVTRRYYYSIKDISIGGRCVCNGHAEVCNAKSVNLFQCECQHNTCGETCDRCCPGYNQKQWQPATANSANECEPCNCHGHATDCYYDPDVEQRRGSLNIYGRYEGGGVCVNCQHNTAGINCEQCAKGYYRPYGAPVEAADGCISCSCNPEHSDGCEEGSGRCHCKVNFHGENCEQCAEGYYSFPSCFHDFFFYSLSPNYIQMPIFEIQVNISAEAASKILFLLLGCACNSAGVLPEICDFLGKCLCRFEVDGPQCDSCRPSYHSFPICETCQCSPHGSYQSICELRTGQCECRTGVTGQQCDRCLSETYSFPYCQGTNNECDPAGTLDSHSGYCKCLQRVEGPTCSRCKPLYWNLARENPDGCTECQCDVTGTLSGVGECQQKSGDCHCKPDVCGGSCDTCEAGYYALENRNYFGCQGCQCDVGGSVSLVCSEASGACQCRNHIVGMTCQMPEKNYFFPDLHHMKFEIEDGTTASGRGIRFGYDPQEFPGFSWRGYAQMSSIQNEVKIILNVEKSNLCLFRVILRYINPGIEVVSGRITAYQSRPERGATQSKDIVFPPSRDPAFVTVPGNGFADPFSLIPGTWIINIMAEGVLLDYLVLLPSDYYEASILQLQVTEPCTYSGHAMTDNCLLYQHLPLVRFSCVLGSEATHFLLGGEYRRIAVRQPTLEHPVMLHVSGREVDLHLRLSIPQVGRYVVVLEYANEDNQLYTPEVIVNSSGPVLKARVNIYSCKYSFLCRSVVLDAMNRIAVYDLSTDAKLHLKASLTNFLLHKICVISAEEFFLEYVEPKVHCLATYRNFLNQSASCIPSEYETPPVALLLNALKDGKISELSLFLQNQLTLSGRVPRVGRYVFVVHFRQPEHPTFPGQVLVGGGRLWSGVFSAFFCPHAFGCRDQVIAENQIELDIPDSEFSIIVKIPNGKTLVVEHVLVVPADSYSHSLLQKSTVDKSFDFINECGENSFYTDPVTSSAFCKDSVRSLVAFYNNGALPCYCHKAGATSPACNPLGGQCSCKPNVIGRRCSRCQTGYYGFPFCKLCNCGRRLCDDITGQCICPPQTVKPKCEVCERQFFNYHPLVGCEGCNCSSRGVVNVANPECEKNNGQCKCRPGIIGRQCDRCDLGSYNFPDCIPCKCNRDGTVPDVCDPQTGVCLCKENVEGTECDICRQGSFYLDPSNPKGCTSCFCFGVTNNCRSTSNRRTKFVDMRNWRVETANNKIDVPVTFNPSSNSVVADVQELSASVHSLYWIAPQSYLGEKLSSYGGYLSYLVKSFGLPSEGMILLDKRPDVQLTGQQMKIVYVDPNNPLPDRQYYGRVQLVEENFRHANNNNLVSREELMMVLSRLDGLHIRGLYYTETQRLTLGEVGLEEAISTGSGSIAYNVETCSCPPDYVGDSCQECSPGFYRENRGLFTGRCVPCSCNGNSNRCQDGSGICINCQYNTAGEKCDRCKEGYFGDATQGSCRVCPCPYTNSFATGCVANGEEVQCFCKEGYTGIHCESCAPGYFGNPLKYGGYCQKCNCNNNGQLSICDRLTGECLNQEPKDVDPDEDCDACDSCVIILLKDLSTMGDELQLIKSQLQNVDASAHTLGQMRHLETRIKDNLQQSLFNNFGQTNQKGKDLVSKIQIIITNIHVLLEQIAGTNSEGNTLPVGDAAKELAEAEQMMREMRNRNFQQLQIDAEKEKREAQLLLEQVRRDLQTHQQENHGVVKTIRDSLNEYEAKLSDLREILKEATGQTKQAESLNKNNGVLLADIKVITLFLFDMNEKLKSLSLSASKEPLVVRAEEHVKFLQDLAKQLAEIKRNTSNDELVSCAMEAATAYENIINAIKAAEEAANKAENAADSALLTVEREDLAGKAKRLNTESNNLLNRAQGAQKTLQGTVKSKMMTGMLIQYLKFTFRCHCDVESIITRAKNMVKNANGITTNVLDELNPIKADVEKIKDTYGSNQSADFNKALTEANNSVKKLTNKLPDLFNKIESINQQLIPIGNISENVNRIRELIHQARDAANKVAVPMRFNGRSGVEVRPPSDLEDLKGYTSLSFFLQRPRQRLDSIRQTPNMFVMYLGNKDASKDYIGMAVKNGHLICVYNLGGNEAEIEVDSSVTESYTEEAILDRVKFERIYQYATLNYVKAASSDKGTFYSNSGSSHTLLNLDPNSVVFYVGGYPSDFTPPDKLDYPHYQGCIELDNLNENVISLYNFKKTFNLNTAEVEPCSRYKAESDENYFEGTGYALVIAKETNIPNLIYEQTIQTTADEGMVFFAENQDDYISLSIENGRLVFTYTLDSQPPKKIASNGDVVNGGTYQQVFVPLSDCDNQLLYFFLFEISFNISTPPFRGCMRNVRDLISGSVTFTETMGVSRKCSDDWKVICKVAFNVCRHSQNTWWFSLKSRDDKRWSPIALHSFSLHTFLPYSRTDQIPQVQNLISSTEKTDVSVGTCRIYKSPQPMLLKELADPNSSKMFKVRLSLLQMPIHIGSQPQAPPLWLTVLKNYVTPFPSCIRSRSHFSVDVRTVSSGGLIFFVGNKPESSYMALYISKGRFVFSFGAGGKKLKIKSKTKYNDGQWHTVVFSMDGKNGRLVIDGLRAREGKLAGNSTVSTKPPIYLGGLPALKIQNIPRKSFVGCVRNFKMNGKLMNAPHRNTGVLPCLDGSLETGIYFFNEGGYIIIDNSFMLGLEFEIVFNIRMRSLTGVLLHTGNEQSNYLTVYMEAGKVTASGNNGAGEFKISISPQQSMCDGQWHSITVTQKQNILQLYVDTKSNYATGSSASLSTNMGHPLYFGRVPANLETPWLPVRDSFHGCLQNIKINDKPVSVSKISEVHGVVSLHGCPAN
uniref:Laminin subunit alpha 3 n=1 Tax=Pelusios castaneus TaxID=367368 RepID=A0A8C8VNC6_9SAUR